VSGSTSLEAGSVAVRLRFAGRDVTDALTYQPPVPARWRKREGKFMHRAARTTGTQSVAFIHSYISLLVMIARGRAARFDLQVAAFIHWINVIHCSYLPRSYKENHTWILAE